MSIPGRCWPWQGCRRSAITARTCHPPSGARPASSSVMSEDCGPCTQLGIDMAERGGVDPAVLRAIVARDFAAMPDEVALVVRFTEATLRHAPEADELREEVVRRFGKRGLVSLAFAMLAGRMYPTVKYALGHGHACMRLTIGGETRPVLREVTQSRNGPPRHERQPRPGRRCVRGASARVDRASPIACSARAPRPRTWCRTRICAGTRRTMRRSKHRAAIWAPW